MPLFFTGKQSGGLLAAVGTPSWQWRLPCQWWERLPWPRLCWQLSNLGKAAPSLSAVKQTVAVVAEMTQMVVVAEVSPLLLAVAAVWMRLYRHQTLAALAAVAANRLGLGGSNRNGSNGGNHLMDGGGRLGSESGARLRRRSCNRLGSASGNSFGRGSCDRLGSAGGDGLRLVIDGQLGPGECDQPTSRSGERR